MVGGFGLGEGEGGGGPSGGAGGAGGRTGLGAGEGLVGAQREVCLGLVQGEFGYVEAEAPRGLAGWAGFEFGQCHVQGGGRLAVGALLARAGSSAQAWSWADPRQSRR